MDLARYKEVQNIAKEVLSELAGYITADSTEKFIASRAGLLMKAKGIGDTWYHDVPALVLLGSRSCLSISGKDYSPSNELVGDTNLVTVDLSPKQGAYWGDCARSICIEKGNHILIPNDEEFSRGLKAEKKLHRSMIDFVTTETTFSDLYKYGNELIEEMGYENLDFLSNLGHSIETQLGDRKFIDENCFDLLSGAKLFTFEPHIRKKGSTWGFKHENIYYFSSEGKVIEL